MVVYAISKRKSKGTVQKESLGKQIGTIGTTVLNRIQEMRK